MKTVADLKAAADAATNAYYRALPGGRRGWKRSTNGTRLAMLHAAMVTANAAFLAAARAP